MIVKVTETKADITPTEANITGIQSKSDTDSTANDGVPNGTALKNDVTVQLTAASATVDDTKATMTKHNDSENAYINMGFEQRFFEDSFENPKIIRNYISDESMYQKMISEYENRPDKNHQYGDYTAVAYYSGHKGENTKWNLEKVDVDANVYTVSIVTTSTGSKPYITRTLIDGTKEYAFNSGFFISDADLDVTSLAAST